MRAITVEPHAVHSLRLEERPEPAADPASILVETLCVGVCGTDHEIVAGQYGWAPAGSARLIIGHESLGRVLEVPDGSPFSAGDFVVGIVREPDPVPCVACRIGEWDMCRNGLYTERGIKSADGFAAERFRVRPSHAVKVAPELGVLGVLLEPASILAKAWDHIERIGRRTDSWIPRTALITGAGPVGLLAALMARQRNLEIHVLDRNESGPKPELVKALGGTYHVRELPADLEVDVVIECTGSPDVVLEIMCRTAGNGIVCLAGISSGGRTVPFDSGAFNRTMVLQNDVVVGSVNANRRHYEVGAAALAAADPAWLSRLITRRVSLDNWKEAFERRPGDIKVILQFASDQA